MPSLGVNVAILQDGKILLTWRKDFEVWCLPGGEVDENESLAQAAVREAFEETGIEVELTRLVGLYSRPGWLKGGLHIAVFAARITGGSLRLQENEVLEAGFFSPDSLPEPFLLGTRQRIMDALDDNGGSRVWWQDANWEFPPDATRQEIYDLRDRSGLSKADFYQQHVGKPGPGGEQLEVGKRS